MNNWAAPKYLFAEGDTYSKFPEDEIYPALIVNYIKVDPLPRFDEDWSPVTKAVRAGDYFVTTGEVLIENFALEGAGSKKQVTARGRMDLSTRIRRSCLGRWRQHRPPGHLGGRARALRRAPLRDSL